MTSAKITSTPLSDELREEWRQLLAAPALRKTNGSGVALIVFRLAGEWFGLPTSAVVEVLPLLAHHRLPHRAPPVQGIVNVTGRITVLVSLRDLISPMESHDPNSQPTTRATLVLQNDGWRCAANVDFVDRIWRPAFSEIDPMPAPHQVTPRKFARGLGFNAGRSVAILDEYLLFEAIRKGLQ